MTDLERAEIRLRVLALFADNRDPYQIVRQLGDLDTVVLWTLNGQEPAPAQPQAPTKTLVEPYRIAVHLSGDDIRSPLNR